MLSAGSGLTWPSFPSRHLHFPLLPTSASAACNASSSQLGPTATQTHSRCRRRARLVRVLVGATALSCATSVRTVSTSPVIVRGSRRGAPSTVGGQCLASRRGVRRGFRRLCAVPRRELRRGRARRGGPGWHPDICESLERGWVEFALLDVVPVCCHLEGPPLHLSDEVADRRIDVTGVPPTTVDPPGCLSPCGDMQLAPLLRVGAKA